MKFSNVIIRVGLIVTVLLSIVLSFIIWSNNQSFDNRSDRTKNVVVSKDASTAINNAYLPTEVLYRDNNDRMMQIYDKTRNIPLELSKKFGKISLSNVSSYSRNPNRYTAMLANSKYLQLVYPDKVTLGTFAKVSKIAGKITKEKRLINRIFVPISGKGKLYFGDDETSKLYITDISSNPIKGLQQIINTANQKIKVELRRVGTEYTPFYTEDTQVGVYSYLITKQSENFFVSKLLGVTNVDSKESSGIATYSTGPYQKVIVNRDKNIFSYSTFEDNTVPRNTAQLFEQSSSYLLKSGLTVKDMRYFENKDNTLSYRYYFEGLPVFLESDNSAAISIGYSSSVTIMIFKNIIFQIPIPVDGRTSTIPATETLVKEINEKGVHDNEIQRIELGLKLVHDKENTDLVDLVPTMYFKIFGEWKDAQSWLQSDIAFARRTADEVK